MRKKNGKRYAYDHYYYNEHSGDATIMSVVKMFMWSWDAERLGRVRDDKTGQFKDKRGRKKNENTKPRPRIQ